MRTLQIDARKSDADRGREKSSTEFQVLVISLTVDLALHAYFTFSAASGCAIDVSVCRAVSISRKTSKKHTQYHGTRLELERDSRTLGFCQNFVVSKLGKLPGGARKKFRSLVVLPTRRDCFVVNWAVQAPYPIPGYLMKSTPLMRALTCNRPHSTSCNPRCRRLWLGSASSSDDGDGTAPPARTRLCEPRPARALGSCQMSHRAGPYWRGGGAMAQPGTSSPQPAVLAAG